MLRINPQADQPDSSGTSTSSCINRLWCSAVVAVVLLLLVVVVLCHRVLPQLI
jgi:hypothetical protein